MAKSRYEYVKTFESDQSLLPNTWIVVRIDGRAFHKFSQKHEFAKPNDERALNLMNRAAVVVMQEFKDIVISFGESDEYSFVFRKETLLYNRREQKIMSYVNSLFSSAYVFHWTEYFKDVKLLYPPLFDARIVLYPTDTNLRDYLSWRQADVHVNNLYNTTFWTLIIKGGLTNREAEKKLSGTFAADKNELLFSEFGINYNIEPVIFRKGTILLRKIIKNPMKSNLKPCQVIYPFHKDLIKNQFWDENSEILSGNGVKTYEWNTETKLLPTLVLKQLPVSDKNGSETSANK
ncbi:tRNA-histidine guanylyltransferase [Carabus blaptoides fortunei]